MLYKVTIDRFFIRNINIKNSMKVLLYDQTNAYLTPGGKTIHALKLQQEIAKLGVDIQFARWWDKSQEDADIMHFLGYNPEIVRQVKRKGMKTFYSMIFDYESNKSELEKRKQMFKNRLFEILPSLSKSGTYWHQLPLMDKIQFMHQYDRDNAMRYFPKHIDPAKVVLIPHAYDPAEMDISGNLDINDMNFPEKYLISVANISTRKQTVKLAQYAKKAQVPVAFMGSRDINDPYFKAFEKEVDNKYVFYPGYVSKEWRDCIEANAAGYVLLSLGESGCIAVYEAAAYRMPLLLSNLPWAWGYEEPVDIHFCDQQDEQKAVLQLKNFYSISCKMDHTPFKVHTWAEIAKIYVQQYENLIK